MMLCKIVIFSNSDFLKRARTMAAVKNTTEVAPSAAVAGGEVKENLRTSDPRIGFWRGRFLLLHKWD